MVVVFSINAKGNYAKDAEEIKNKIEAILAEHGLTGTIRGNSTEHNANFNGSYRKQS